MIEVSLRHGDLAYARHAVLVGHYFGDTIVSAEQALGRDDQALLKGRAIFDGRNIYASGTDAVQYLLAYALGGVAGHAGLFSTADDLAKFCRMILGGGALGGALLAGGVDDVVIVDGRDRAALEGAAASGAPARATLVTRAAARQAASIESAIQAALNPSTRPAR